MTDYEDLAEKAKVIQQVLHEPTVDLWKLRDLALSKGGLVNDTLRKRAWPKLVGLQTQQETTQHARSPPTPKEEDNSSPASPSNTGTPSFEIDTTGSSLAQDHSGGKTKLSAPTAFPLDHLVVACQDAEQIERDVARCTWHLLTGSQRSRRAQIESKDKSKKIVALLRRKQKRLANLINLSLAETTTSGLRYYQGYHDVACIFMHALGGGATTAAQTSSVAATVSDPFGLSLASLVLAQVSHSHLEDFCQDTFMRLQTTLHGALYPLLWHLDPAVHNALQDVDMEPFFCLSWVLTWFSHDVRDTTLCKRLFDAFLASHPALVIYVSIAMLCHPYNRQCILETDCDFAALHHTLAQLPRHSCRVGWKKMPAEGGYVSDHEEEEKEDDQTASTDLASSLVAPSMTSFEGDDAVGVDNGKCQVPFESLLEMALGYMSRYPPRSLTKLAKRYYAESASPQIQTTDDIVLLQQAPQSCLRSFSVADWVWKLKWRQEHGLPPTSRNDRRRKKSSSPFSPVVRQALTPQQESDLQALLDNQENDPIDLVYLKQHATDRAVIAAGFGPGPEAVLARKAQRRRYAAAMAVGFVAMSLGLILQYYCNDNAPRGPTLSTIPLNSGSSIILSTSVASDSIEEVSLPTKPPKSRDTTSRAPMVAVSPTRTEKATLTATTIVPPKSQVLSTDSISSRLATGPATEITKNDYTRSTVAEREQSELVKPVSTNNALTNTTTIKALEMFILRPFRWVIHKWRLVWGKWKRRLTGSRS